MSGLDVAATTVGEGLRYKTVAMARGEREEQFFPEAVIAVLGMSDPLVVAEQGVDLSRSSSLNLHLGIAPSFFFFF